MLASAPPHADSHRTESQSSRAEGCYEDHVGKERGAQPSLTSYGLPGATPARDVGAERGLLEELRQCSRGLSAAVAQLTQVQQGQQEQWSRIGGLEKELCALRESVELVEAGLRGMQATIDAGSGRSDETLESLGGSIRRIAADVFSIKLRMDQLGQASHGTHGTGGTVGAAPKVRRESRERFRNEARERFRNLEHTWLYSERLQRKFRKLMRDPERFFADARVPLVRALGQKVVGMVGDYRSWG